MAYYEVETDHHGHPEAFTTIGGAEVVVGTPGDDGTPAEGRVRILLEFGEDPPEGVTKTAHAESCEREALALVEFAKARAQASPETPKRLTL